MVKARAAAENLYRISLTISAGSTAGTERFLSLYLALHFSLKKNRLFIALHCLSD